MEASGKVRKKVRGEARRGKTKMEAMMKVRGNVRLARSILFSESFFRLTLIILAKANLTALASASLRAPPFFSWPDAI